MASTEVEIRDNRELRRVEALDPDGEVAGFADYQISVDGDTFDFHHTEVDERFEGQGIGSRLAAGVMEFARSEGVKIVASCSFLDDYMEKNDETHDLRAPEPSGEADDDTDDTDDTDDSDDDAPDEDSPDAGPADAKAAGSGGATEEEDSRA